MALKPDFRLYAEGEDITDKVMPFFAGMTITDQIGASTDTFQLTLAYPPVYAFPDTGATLRVEIGYQATGLWEVGSFVVDTLRVSGSATSVRQLVVTAESMPSSPTGARASLQNAHNHAYGGGMTFGQIVDHVISRAGLTALVDADVRSIPMPVTVQFNETDAEFLYRICVFRDVVIKYNDTDVAFARKDAGLLGTHTVQSNTVLDYNYDVKDRTRYSKLIVPYQDKDAGEVLYYEFGQGEPVKRIRSIAPDAETAQEMASKYLKELFRKTFAIDFTVPGQREFVAEQVLSLTGFPKITDGDEFVIMSATHSLTSTNFQTKCQAKARG